MIKIINKFAAKSILVLKPHQNAFEDAGRTKKLHTKL